MKLFLALIYSLKAILTDSICGGGLVRTMEVRAIILMENLFLYKKTIFFNIEITMQLIAPGYPVATGLKFFVTLVFSFKDP